MPQEKPIVMKPVGVVAPGRAEVRDHFSGGVSAEIELSPELPADALDGLEEFSHAEVLYLFDRVKALQAALADLEPKPAGRPAEDVPESDRRVAELQARIAELRMDAEAARIREEIALAMPHLLARQKNGRAGTRLPVEDENADTAAKALAALFAEHGPPLVLKSDNGSPFIADRVRILLAEHGVIQLLSPAYTPQYNGSIEAGTAP